MCDPHLAFWQQCMLAEDLTPRTIEERVRLIHQFQRTTGPYLTASRSDIIAFLGCPTWANSTREHYRAALHHFFAWLQDEGIRPDNPTLRLPKVRHRRRQPNPVPVHDIERALESGAYRRTRLMIALHYYAMLRVHEIAKLHGRDLDWRNRVLNIIGKGKKLRHVPICDELWILVVDMPHDAYWFPNWKENRLYAAGEGHILSNSVSRVISDALRRAGVDGHRPHDLRATGITEQVRHGVHILVIQQNAGHQSSETTQLYALVDVDQQRAGVNTLTPVRVPARSGRTSAA